jgi:hypothetical protein
MDHELFKACFSISKAFFKYLTARAGSLASRYVPPILLTVDATFEKKNIPRNFLCNFLYKCLEIPM